ncbi:serine/arginine-rich splicing factor 6-like [Ruditapes philippinarum]|uniref:serine/arginine-rich splicing factor 6-like n=1 Tax=Ruditapes philippinarum TaxID=129788 RepID=UPI00295C27C6|nr:serine/arginine-rich splicing factor 6-like [Ruditapes philippinarum]
MSGSKVYVGRLASDTREKDVERFFKGYGRLRDVSMKNGYGFVEFDDPRDADDAVYELNGKELLGERLIIEHARASRGRGGGGGFRGGGGGRFGGGGGYGGGGYGGGGGRYGGAAAVAETGMVVVVDATDTAVIEEEEEEGGHMAISQLYCGRKTSGAPLYGPPQRTDYRLRVENLSSRASWQDLKDHMRTAGVEVSFADAHKQRTGEGVVDCATESDMLRALEKLDGMDINGKKIRLVEERGGSSSGGGGRDRGRRSRSRSRSRSDSRSRSRSRSKSRSRSSSPPQERSRRRSGDEPEDD